MLIVRMMFLLQLRRSLVSARDPPGAVGQHGGSSTRSCGVHPGELVPLLSLSRGEAVAVETFPPADYHLPLHVGSLRSIVLFIYFEKVFIALL